MAFKRPTTRWSKLDWPEQSKPGFCVRAADIEEKLGSYGGNALITLYQLCTLYDRVNKPENAAACNAKIVVMLEKLYGPNDLVLTSTLKSAAKIDQRIDAFKGKCQKPKVKDGRSRRN